jgi:hypothetical protein
MRLAVPGTPASAPVDAPARDTKNFPIMVTSLGVAARHLRSQVRPDRGYRTLVAGTTATIDVRSQGAELVRVLTGPGMRVILVEWNADGRSIAEALGAASRPGMMELLEGAASLHQVIQPLPGTAAYFIGSGGPSSKHAARDGDRVNLVLDGLDESYDHIVFVGEYDALHQLFTIIEGRFDTVIEIDAPAGYQDHQARPAPGMIFGCHVSDIEILRLNAAATVPRRAASLVRPSVEAHA